MFLRVNYLNLYFDISIQLTNFLLTAAEEGLQFQTICTKGSIGSPGKDICTLSILLQKSQCMVTVVKPVFVVNSENTLNFKSAKNVHVYL